jgi:hypothetical protein
MNTTGNAGQGDPQPSTTVSPTPLMMATAVDPPIAAPQASIAPAPAPAPTASTPDDRATSFQAVEGGTESRSGETLLVEAYVVLWVILMGWLYLTWRRQSTLGAQLDDLEKTIDKAATKKTEKK